MAEGAMAELRAPLAPGDDFAAIELFADFFVELIIAGHIAIDDFAVVENGFDFLRCRLGAEGQGGQLCSARMAGEFLAGKKTRAERGAGVSRHGLDINIFEAAAKFKCTDEKYIQKHAAGEAERIGAGAFAEIIGKRNYKFFEMVLRAASDICAKSRSEWSARFRKASFAEEARRKNTATVGASVEVGAIQNWKTFRVERKSFAKGGEEFRFAVLAEPLYFVLIAIDAKTEIVRDARIKPADGIGKCKIAKRFDAIAIAKGDGTRAGHGTLIEGEDQRAIETRGVISAGSVGKMMIETEDLTSAGKKLA